MELEMALEEFDPGKTSSPLQPPLRARLTGPDRVAAP